MEDEEGAALGQAQYAALAAFRHALRRFLSFSEAAALAAGLPPQQHQALLAIAGHGGAEPPTVGMLAEQLIIAPHSAAELVGRMVEAGLVRKVALAADRRRVGVVMTPRAEGVLRRLTAAHLRELAGLAPALVRVLGGG